MTRRLLWVSLPDQRPRRELYWMSRMPGTALTALAAEQPVGQLRWLPATYRRPIKRFVEAGALAWIRELSGQDPADYDWVASLELCSLVTGQSSAWRKRARRQGRPLRQAVITWENLPQQPLYRVPFYRQAFESCRDADLLLCMVDAAADHLVANGFDSERIRVVKPGVDTVTFAPALRPCLEPVVCFASPLAQNKGIDTLLRAMVVVRQAVPAARLVVAGTGPLEPLVRERAADPTSGVSLVGGCDSAGVAELMRQSAVFATAPRPTYKWTEQLGLAYLEAQACALPVVTTACGTNQEALAPPNSLITPEPHERANRDPSPRTVEALAQALVELLENPAERARIGRINREYITTHHDLATQCAAMGAAFASCEGA